jgi:hypothetical protein
VNLGQERKMKPSDRWDSMGQPDRRQRVAARLIAEQDSVPSTLRLRMLT